MAAGTLRSVNPATGEELAAFAEHTPEVLESALAAADAAQRAWATTSFAERRRCLEAAARLLREGREDYARLATLEMGKPIAEAAAEVDKCAWNCEFYAAQAERFLANEPVETDALSSWVAYQPLGVVLAIMPWNFPYWQVLRFAAPALMAGNGALLKHSPNVPRCALATEELFARAGFPEGLFRTLLVGDASVGEASGRLLADPRVGAVTLTGSERAGAAVGATAGRALKKCVLELGGSDPFVVLADADLELAAEAAARARFLNGGQSCIAAKRFVVEEPVADEFERRFVHAVAALPVGDPLDPATRVGPLARADLLDALERQVEGSVAGGAKVLLGGARLERPGWYYAPTVLAGVTPDLPVFTEETFGPVAAVVRAPDEEAAVELANDTPYGLGASVWTRDLERARRLGRRIESGSLFVNAVVASDPRLPFGGIKRSGYGRELAAVGIHEFTNIRTFWVQAAGTPPPTTL
ncbi:MAG TPA: NAD-dependent succinate-semialdehyde dehydrogenase, partial [Actinomycetes bacterium]|nr:NAD-dependent succinate-semialdehyde dehydrogenase [Actinomycetes bacterium]